MKRKKRSRVQKWDLKERKPSEPSVPDMTRMQIIFVETGKRSPRPRAGRLGAPLSKVLLRCNVMLVERRFGEGRPFITIEVIDPKDNVMAVTSFIEHVRGGKVV